MCSVVRDFRSLRYSEKWSPVKGTKRPCSHGCENCQTVFSAIVSYLEQHIQGAFLPDSLTPVEEVNFRKQSRGFSELQRIKNHPQLSQRDKLALIRVPSRKYIHWFVAKLFEQSHARVEIQIHTLVILKRFLKATQWTLRSANWRILLILSLRLSQKVESELSLDGEDLETIYGLFSAKEIIRLERIYLKLIDYDCLVSASVYTSELASIFAKVSA
mmetsp:Transcript_51239/g.58724  ORF Transcript_51239/g.58724 Transcript_51239/m.58724 type:complete len:216 (+) Transcript_51239:39-686(+)